MKKINFLYLLTFIDKIISCNGCSICGMSNSKNKNLYCSLKNSSYQLVTKYVILTQGHVTYNIAKLLFDFN